MGTLKFEEVYPYLPYGLIIQYKIEGWSGAQFYESELIDLNFRSKEANSSCIASHKLADIKPLLIPISEFGAWDEIFMRGLSACVWEEEIFSLAFEYHDDAVECLIYVNDIKYNCTFSYINGNLEFNGDIMFNQWAAFAEMFKQHIDVFGLIERGLALNKLTFKP